MKRSIVWVVLALLLGLGAAAYAAGQVSIAVVWSGNELDTFQKVINQFEQETGITVNVDAVGRDLPTVLPVRVAAGNPPDVAALPNPGQMKTFALQGALQPLDSLSNLADSSPALVNLGTVKVNGTDHVYGIFIGADVKSLVWYDPKNFTAKGYTVPTSWPALIALSQQMIANGDTPWTIGLESGAASGWPGTDWIEDIMLRTAGPVVYDQWVNHEISWTSPAVKTAFQYFGQIALNPKMVYGGTTGELLTNFGDAPNALFTTPPEAYMLKQATFIQSFILTANPNLKAGEDYDVFTFPEIQPQYGTPLLGSGDLVGVFNATPEAMALANYLASAEAQAIWCGDLGKIAVNTKVDPSIYSDPITKKAADMLASATIFRFDGSDLMPVAVGSGTFWSGVLDYINGIPLDTVLQNIEDSAVAAYAQQ
jgi:alpha-glucoside transport system substrate-binding protein